MPEKPTIVKKTTVGSSKLFRLETVDLRFSNGEERQYECVRGTRGRGSVMIAAVLDNEHVILVREYAAGVHDYVLGFPKGLIDQGEDTLTAANRELQEETGYAARELSILSTVSTSPGYMGGRMPIVLAQDLYASKLEGDEPEEIEVVPWRLDELDKLLTRDDFHEARCIAALFLVREHLNVGV